MKKEQAIDELKKMRMHFRNLRWKESLPDAEKAIDMAIEALNSTIEAEPNSCEYWDSESHFCALRRPQAEPVKHGRWRVTHELESWDIVYCSECGEGMWNAKGDNLPNYCHNCGAKMDGGENG